MGYVHTNTKGNVYYLHTVKTKADKNLYYFCKRQDNKGHAMIDIPEGFEVVEGSISMLPCLRRKK